jgi:hypothetical protein
VTAFLDAVAAVIEEHHPGHGLSALHRARLACWVTASLGTNAVCWARFERASLGTYALAALSWMCRHAKRPWELLLVASVRRLLRHDGRTHGGRVVDETDKQRAQSAPNIASRHQLRAKERGGCILGHSLVFLLCVTPKITLPWGVAFSLPAPERTAWDQPERTRTQQGVPRPHRPPKPPPNPPDPTTHALARRWFQPGNAQPPDRPVPGVVADALAGTAAFVAEAAPIGAGGQVISQLRRHQKVRADKRESQGAEYGATPPARPQQRRLRGGDEVGASVGSARFSVSAPHTKRCIMALNYAGEDT